MTRALLLLCLTGACSGGLGASSRALEASDSLSAASRATLEETPLPVLVFPARYAPQTRATSGEHFFALSAQVDNTTLFLGGTNVVHTSLPESAIVPPPDAEVRGMPAHTTVNEGIRIVTWGEPGAYYSLEIECNEHPRSDSRCTSPGFALDLADELVRYEAVR